MVVLVLASLEEKPPSMAPSLPVLVGAVAAVLVPLLLHEGDDEDADAEDTMDFENGNADIHGRRMAVACMM